MVFSYFSAYGFSETETSEKLFQFRNGLFEPSETKPIIPREFRSRTFPFAFLLNLSLQDLKSTFSDLDWGKTGVLCGSATGGLTQLTTQYNKFKDKGLHKMSPLTVLQTIHNSASSVLSIENKAKGISSGYNCLETSGVEALSDGIALIKSGEYENIFVGAGEDLTFKNCSLQLVGGGIFLTKNSSDKKCFEIECLINRGKPWLSANDNFIDIIEGYYSKFGRHKLNTSKNENWICFNYQMKQGLYLKNYPISFESFQSLVPYLSLTPFLGISVGLQKYPEFKLLTISSEGHGVLLHIKRILI